MAEQFAEIRAFEERELKAPFLWELKRLKIAKRVNVLKKLRRGDKT